MKRLCFIIANVLISAALFGQAPSSFKYQTVLRDGSGNVKASTDVIIDIAILQDSATGTQLFLETHSTSTNEFGLVNLEIGSINTTDFKSINWSDGTYFVKLIVDGTEMGTSQLLSVPYALFAKTAENALSVNYNDIMNKPEFSVSEFGDTLFLDSNNYIIIPGISGANHPDTSTITDVQGNTYRTIRIGEQIWMAENLAYLPSVSPSSLGSTTEPHYYVFGYEGSDTGEAMVTHNYNIYGVLYNWPAAMNGANSSNSNPSGVQGVCPSGWHLPSDSEWKELVDFLGGESIAGGKLKEAGYNHWLEPNAGANNSSGFTALPGGNRGTDGLILWESYFGHWWSSTKYDDSKAFLRILSYSIGDIGKSYNPFEFACSVRCVKD